MKITSLKLSDIYRTQFVKRWHILNTPRQQTVAEHSYLVCMLVLDLCERIGIPEKETHEAILWALVHDLPEVVMGDPVSPIKNIARDKFDELEAKIDPDRWSFASGLSALASAVVKLADYIDAVKFLHEEGINDQSKVVREKLNKNMSTFIVQLSYALPGYDWNRGYSCLLEYIYGEQTYIDNLMP